MSLSPPEGIVNARERFLAVLDRRMPDRVPTFEIIIHPGVIDALCPGCTYADFVEAMDIEGAITGTPSSLYTKTVVDAERHLVRDEWGVTRQVGVEVVPMPMGGPIATMDDLRDLHPARSQRPRPPGPARGAAGALRRQAGRGRAPARLLQLPHLPAGHGQAAHGPLPRPRVGAGRDRPIGERTRSP